MKETLRILLVENDPQAIEQVRSALSSGFDVTVVGDRTALQTCLGQGNFDLTLIEPWQVGTGEPELRTWLLAENLPKPLVILTSRTTVLPIADIESLAASAYLVKSDVIYCDLAKTCHRLIVKHRLMLRDSLDIQNGVILLDQDLVVQAYNSTAFVLANEIIGRDLTVGLSARDVMREQDYRFLKNVIENLSKEGQEKWISPIPISLACGRWLRISFNLLFGEKDQISGIYMNFQDLSQPIDIQEALRSREETLRTLINVNPAATFLIDPKGIILAANDGVPAWYHLSNEEFIGTNIFDYIPSPTREIRQQIVDEIVKTGKTKTITETSQGRSLRTTIYPVFDEVDDVHQIGIFVVDITEQKMAEEAFQRRDAILEAVNFASEQFLQADSWRDRIQEVLHRWSEATATNRAFIYKRTLNSSGKFEYSLMYGWDSSGSIPDFARQEFQNFSMKSTIFAQIEETISRGEVASIKISEIDSGLFDSFQHHDCKSLLVVPVRLDEEVWGFIGFADSNLVREWSTNELEAVKTAAQIFSAAIRREREEASRAALLDALPDLMFLLNRNGEFVDYHTQDPAMLAVPPEKFLGTKIGQALSGEVAVMTRKAFEQVLLTGIPQTYEYRLVLGNSEYWKGHMVRSGEGAVVIIHDVTEQRHSEEELRQAEEAVSKLYEITSSSVLSFIEKQRALLQMGCQRFGMENGTILQPVFDAFEVIQAYSPGGEYKSSTKIPMMASFSQEVIRSNQTLVIENAANSQWKDHPAYLIHKLQSYMGAPLIVGGKSFGVISFSSTQPKKRPITQAEQRFLHLMSQWIGLEMEREQYLSQLQSFTDEISSKNRELAEARDEALEAARMKTEFLATMSHEIRTPMNAVMGMTELLLSSPLDAEQRQYAETTRDSARLLLSLLNDVLDLSKIEAGKLVLEQIVFDPHKVLDEAVSMFGLQAHLKRIQLNAFIAPQIPRRVKGDPVRFSQVVINLVANAIKFTDQGSVMVWTEVLSETPQTIELMIRVRDTGIGLSEDSKEKIFLPFTQADGSTTRRFGGTGLGLSITKRLVEKMDGTIGVESEEGVGSIFWFTVKFTRAEDPSSENGESERTFSTSQKILVYENQKETRYLWQRYLEDWKIPFDLAESPQQIVERLISAKKSGLGYAVCILDLESIRCVDNKAFSKVIHLLQTNKCKVISITSYEKRARSQNSILQDLLYGRLVRPFSRNTVEKLLSGVFSNAIGQPSEEKAASMPVQCRTPNPPLTDKLVLLAEDNIANQRLAEVQLQHLGYSVVTVASGTQAVDELAQRYQDYGLVLMDMQMPGMDGCDATRLIRKSEQVAGGHLPIIAMTANALHDDRQACLNAGMDDYVAKPVLLDDLAKVISHCLSAKERGLEREPVQRVMEETDILLDECVLADLRSLNQPDQPDFLVQLIELYLKDSASLMQKIRDAATTEDREILRSAVHSLKGISSNLGAVRLTKMCWQVEYCIRNADSLPEGWLVSLENDYLLTCNALQQVLPVQKA